MPETNYNLADLDQRMKEFAESAAAYAMYRDADSWDRLQAARKKLNKAAKAIPDPYDAAYEDDPERSIYDDWMPGDDYPYTSVLYKRILAEEDESRGLCPCKDRPADKCNAADGCSRPYKRAATSPWQPEDSYRVYRQQNPLPTPKFINYPDDPADVYPWPGRGE